MQVMMEERAKVCRSWWKRGQRYAGHDGREGKGMQVMMEERAKVCRSWCLSKHQGIPVMVTE